ncbi:MAG: capsular biosynthesis protein [Pseudomonadota bacterium]
MLVSRKSGLTKKMSNRVLILQGPPSVFAKTLFRDFAARDVFVLKVNFSFGDWLYFGSKGAVNYKGSLQDWPAYLEDLITTHQITDIIYYADRLPYHRAAQAVAKRLNLRAISYEFGYLRPDWIVVEQGGQSAYSYFPNDMKVIRNLSKNLSYPDLTPQFPYKFSVEATHEVIFNLSNFFLRIFYPRYQSDKYYNQLVEFLNYIPRLIKRRWRTKAAEKLAHNLVSSKARYFLVPLQMQNDYQIRSNSPYAHLHDFIEEVMISFAAHAKSDDALVFKKHPLDNGLENWAKVLRKLAKKHDLSDRYHFMDGGDLDALTKAALGTVVVNSTVGLTALHLGCPVKVMGVAVYDIEGVTFQGKLDAFWHDPKPADMINIDALIKLLAHSIHEKGNFYTDQGREAAARGIVNRVLEGRVNDGGYPLIQTRLKNAKALGIAIDS